MNYQEAINYLESLEIFGIKLGLYRMEILCQRLGSPEMAYKKIHVTGTNGKGSTSRMLAEIFTTAGQKTGLFTSPHLIDYRERFLCDGQQISEKEFAECVEEIKTIAQTMDEPPTQFEVLTAIGFLWFQKIHVDVAVIEVGLGGLLDSTNVILPEVSVITNVAFEHAEKCGGTLEGVATHKAGIIKKNIPVFTAEEENSSCEKILKTTAAEKNAPYKIYGKNFSVEFLENEDTFQKLRFHNEENSFVYELPLLGMYQRKNSALAIEVALFLKISPEIICKALKKVVWAGRFEVVRKKNYFAVIDGAHNPAGALAFRKSLDDFFPESLPRIFLLGILQDKDYAAMLKIFLRPNDILVVTKPHSHRAGDPKILASLAEKNLGVKSFAYEDNFEAFAFAQNLAKKNHALFVMTGSLYLIGTLRKFLNLV